MRRKSTFATIPRILRCATEPCRPRRKDGETKYSRNIAMIANAPPNRMSSQRNTRNKDDPVARGTLTHTSTIVTIQRRRGVLSPRLRGRSTNLFISFVSCISLAQNQSLDEPPPTPEPLHTLTQTQKRQTDPVRTHHSLTRSFLGPSKTRLDQQCFLDRLSQVVITPCIKTLLPITFHGVGGQREDW